AAGTSSCSSSNRFCPTSTFNVLTPVRLAPGRLRLATSPAATGSTPATKTIGIVEVAVFAASAEETPPPAAITLTGRRTTSAANSGVDRIGHAPSDIRLPHSGPRHSRFRLGPGETRRQ